MWGVGVGRGSGGRKMVQRAFSLRSFSSFPLPCFWGALAAEEEGHRNVELLLLRKTVVRGLARKPRLHLTAVRQ